MGKLLDLSAFRKDKNLPPSLTGRRALYIKGNGKELKQYPNGRPCKIVRKCDTATDPMLEMFGLEDMAPCILLEFEGEEGYVAALTEEVVLTD